MTAADRPGVLVAGAGPTGLMTAVELARHGVRARVVERGAAPSGRCRALAVQMRTLEVLAQTGLLERALAAGLRVRAANLYRDGRREHRFEIDPTPTPQVPYPFLLSLEQSETERILRERLAELGGSVEWGTELAALEQDADGVTATLRDASGRERRARASYLVGCDGAGSAVRRLAGIPFEGDARPESFLLADVDLTGGLAADESHRFMAGERVLVVWPIRGTGRFFITGPEDGEPRGPAQPTLADAQAFFDSRGPAGMALRNPRWLARYRVQRRIAARFRSGRVFLAGDAAHAQPTTGAQGLNTGVQDAFNLGWKLALAVSRGGDEALLDSYEAERRPVAEDVIRISETVFAGPPGRGAEVRQSVVAALTQLGINYRASPIVGEARVDGMLARNAPEPGDRAPDGDVDAPARRLFALMREPTHSLLLFTGSEPGAGPSRPLREAADAAIARYGGLVDVHWVVGGAPPEELPAAASAVRDGDGRLHTAYGAQRGALYVVRPDGYVGFRAEPPLAGAVADHLGRVLGP